MGFCGSSCALMAMPGSHALADALRPSAWRHWHTHWEAALGRHLLEARTWGRDGAQAETVAALYPGGAGRYHRTEIGVNG